MYTHIHPYEPFLFEAATKWIVGTLPPPRFSQGMLRAGDVDFCYGSRDGQLWRILDRIFELDLSFETTSKAVVQRKEFLIRRGIGICDIVERADRKKIDASDLGMVNIALRDMLGLLRQYPRVQTLLFTGGNSKNGPEFHFRRLLRAEGIKLVPVVTEVPRIHRFALTGTGREITTISLTAPSGSANRAVGALPGYKARKAADPNYTVMDFRVDQYRRFF